jgi:maleate cis-trans isomerase
MPAIKKRKPAPSNNDAGFREMEMRRLELLTPYMRKRNRAVDDGFSIRVFALRTR